MATAWDFLLNRVPNDVNGLKAYFTNPSLYSGTLAPVRVASQPGAPVCERHRVCARVLRVFRRCARHHAGAVDGGLPPRTRPDPGQLVVGSRAVCVRVRELPRVRCDRHVRYGRTCGAGQDRRARGRPDPPVPIHRRRSVSRYGDRIRERAGEPRPDRHCDPVPMAVPGPCADQRSARAIHGERHQAD